MKDTENASFSDQHDGDYLESDPLLKPSEEYREPLWRQYTATFVGKFQFNIAFKKNNLIGNTTYEYVLQSYSCLCRIFNLFSFSLNSKSTFDITVMRFLTSDS